MIKPFEHEHVKFHSGAPKALQKIMQRFLRDAAPIKSRQLLTHRTTKTRWSNKLQKATSKRQPPKEKKNRKLLTSVGCMLFSVNAHVLDKEAAYNAEERIWLEPPHPPLTIINFIKAKAGEGSSAARLPQTAVREPVP